jgi:hypothetical protein
MAHGHDGWRRATDGELPARLIRDISHFELEFSLETRSFLLDE